MHLHGIQICHEINNRVHLRIPALKGDLNALNQLKSRIYSVPIVDSVEIRPRTGSLIIKGCSAIDLSQSIDDFHWFQPAKKGKIRSQFLNTIETYANKIDQFLIRSSSGLIDGLTILAIVCFLFALKQTKQNMFLPAGFTMFVWSIRMMKKDKMR